METKEKVVLLNQLLKEFTEEQLDILSCLVENEIESDVDYIKSLEGKEKECWKEEVLKLKDILIQLKPIIQS